MSFWTENGDLSTLIHDTNGQFAVLGWQIKKLSEHAKAHVKDEDSSRLFVMIEYVKSAQEQLKQSIDYYYTKQKAKYDQAAKASS